MFFVAKWALAIILAAITRASFDVGAQTLVRIYSHQSAGPVARFNGAAQLTGKERLGEKWKDEQRIDNCKVPLDKRGTKPRPDSCAHIPPTDE
jgi:hypothetical protein